ncbi:MAG TPA: hypothetical protein VGI74_19975 [Streptosporangiaceae bacterium]
MVSLKARRSAGALTVLLVSVLPLMACSGGAGARSAGLASVIHPQRVIAAPKGLLSAAGAQPNATIWALAGTAKVKALYEFDLVSGRLLGSVPVSSVARSVAESPTGLIGVALGAGNAGALELLNSNTAAVTRTVPLGAPARELVTGSNGATFYVLDGTASSSSVTIVSAVHGQVEGTVPVPLDTVSIAPDTQGTALYALQPGGRVSEITVAGGKVTTSFSVGGSGRSLALSPDGSKLYVLKNVSAADNVAVVDLATESVHKVLPAASNCRQLLVSANGDQLYQVVGTAGYGNIQVFPS